METTTTPTDLTPKAQRTRAHIFATALTLFVEKGYHATTMRDIAARSGCSLGLAYRYFAAKEELVVAIYEQTTEDLALSAPDLPASTLAVRYTAIIRANFVRLAPYREAFAAISGVALNPASEVGVFSERMTPIRHRVWSLFREVITGAKDAPRERDTDSLATLAYAAYLLLMLFWVQDRGPGQETTERLLGFIEETIARLRPLLSVPAFARSAARLAEIIGPMFSGKE